MPRVALVTGAARGIGREIALRLAADGLDVAVNDVPGSAAELGGVVKEIEAAGRRSCAVFGDVSREEEVERVVREAVDKLGGLDVMVANAGILYVGGMLATSAEDMDRVMSVNIRGVYLCYKHAAKQMIAQGRGGRIIGASSMAGKQGYPFLFAYSASKFAVRGMTQAAAAELAPHGITVNAYAPSVIQTDMATKLFEDMTSQGVGGSGDGNPMGRLGTPDDISSLVSYLASEGSSFVTGQSIAINGGNYFD